MINKSVTTFLQETSRYYLTLFSVVLMLLSTPASAAGWTPLAAIIDLQIAPNAIYVRLDPAVAVTNLSNCSNYNGYFQILEATVTLSDFQNVLVSTILSADARGKKVKFYSAGCNAAGYNSIDYVGLY